jgi:NADH dehydrogenase/NADH:ubiquinone oxidoreductase subunit G
MITLTINGLNVSVEEGTTVLEAARFLGFPIPTLCHKEGLSPYGACRLCVVEIGQGPKARLVSSCTYPAEEGLSVRPSASAAEGKTEASGHPLISDQMSVVSVAAASMFARPVS